MALRMTIQESIMTRLNGSSATPRRSLSIMEMNPDESSRGFKVDNMESPESRLNGGTGRLPIWVNG